MTKPDERLDDPYKCRVCGYGNLCDVCHKHDEPKSSCGECKRLEHKQKAQRRKKGKADEMWKAFGCWLSQRTNHEMPSHNDHGLFWQEADAALAAERKRAVEDALDRLETLMYDGVELSKAIGKVKEGL